jgi:hypothetical protein
MEGHIQRANAYLESHFMIRGMMDRVHLPGTEGRFGYRLEVSDPDKLIPPPGAYAGSFQTVSGVQKGLVLITEDGIELFPVTQEFGPGEGDQTIHFYKQIGNGVTRLPDKALKQPKNWSINLFTIWCRSGTHPAGDRG